MPTPVSAARQCLTEEAAAALDDAVAVAKRRSHAQTTSLHALSALLALPSSNLRDACSRARIGAYSPRLQLHALELSVGISLDRLPTVKNSAGAGAGDDPPISNSLMAAIKRSQANQRRHPDTFHLYQQSNSQNSTSICGVKVEMKHFVLSILDDPIVSRVFGEAGYRSTELKFAIFNPPTSSRFSKLRCPPLFICNLESNRSRFNFPFTGALEGVDENSSRIGEVFVKMKSSRNPLLVGVCADDALKNFIMCLQSGGNGVLPKELDGVRVVSIENEVIEFMKGGLCEEALRCKFREVGSMVESCEGPGVIVNYGNVQAFVDTESVDAANYVVSKLKTLLSSSRGDLWLIGAALSDDHYKQLLARFPSIEMDLDLHVLPITSLKPSSTGGLFSKSSLMGSFVPFGGFFSMPSDYETPSSEATQASTLCNSCRVACEQELSAVLKGGTSSLAERHLPAVPAWLQMGPCGMSRGLNVREAEDGKTILDSKVMVLQRKWLDICKRLNHTRSLPEDSSQSRAQVDGIQPFPFPTVWKESKLRNSLLDESQVSSSSPFMPLPLQTNSLVKKIWKPIELDTDANAQDEVPVQGPRSHLLEVDYQSESSCSQSNISMPTKLVSTSIAPVTTDLGLGALYTSSEEKQSTPNVQRHYTGTQCLPRLSKSSLGGSCQAGLSSWSCNELEKNLSVNDLKHPWKDLAVNVSWQIDAIHTISQTVSKCRDGNGRPHGSSKRAVWLSFLGPDKVGKRKIARALARIIFGGEEHFLSVNLRPQDVTRPSESIIDHQDSRRYDVNSGRQVVADYIAEELSKRPYSVVLIENVEADFLVQNSLSQAVKTGKFPNSHGREIGINNIIFILTSSVTKVNNVLRGQVSTDFSEEMMMEARNLEMQILVEPASGNYSRNSNMKVQITTSKTSGSCSGNKRKAANASVEDEVSKRICHTSKCVLDLNLPAEEVEDTYDVDECQTDVGSDYSEVLLKELLDEVDENVVFKPFNFDALAQKFQEKISNGLQKVVGEGILLEIDRQVMIQILAASWLTDNGNALENWIEQILFPSLLEARQKHQVSAGSVMKLVQCKGLAVEEHAPGVCLPVKIILN